MGETRRIERHPGQPVFRPNGHFRRVGFGLIERANCYVDPLAIFMILEEERRPAAGGRRTQPISMLHLPDFSGKKLDLLAPERTPGDEGRSTCPPTIKTMAVAHLFRRLECSVTHAAAQTSAADNFYTHRCIRFYFRTPTELRTRGEDGT